MIQANGDVSLPKFSKLAVNENNHAVLLYSFKMMESRVGNFLGYYFEALSCAVSSEVNFKAIDLQATGDLQSFLVELPLQIRSMNSSIKINNVDNVNKNVMKYCKCFQFCYMSEDSAWKLQLELISKSFSNAMNNYIKKKYFKNNLEIIINNVSLSNINTVEIYKEDISNENAMKVKFHPLIPDITIQIRCSDIINLQSLYGFLNFYTYTSIIPLTAKNIYITSDSSFRGNEEESKICSKILHSLFDFLNKEYTNAVIIVKRGGLLLL
jgi:hypothetical protein